MRSNIEYAKDGKTMYSMEAQRFTNNKILLTQLSIHLYNIVPTCCPTYMLIRWENYFIRGGSESLSASSLGLSAFNMAMVSGSSLSFKVLRQRRRRAKEGMYFLCFLLFAKWGAARSSHAANLANGRPWPGKDAKVPALGALHVRVHVHPTWPGAAQYAIKCRDLS